MKTFEKYIDAEKYAMEVSAKELKSISIVNLFKKKDFTVMDTPNEWFYGITHVMLITNFETPFELHWKLFKNGSTIIEAFPTQELVEKRFKELKGAGYGKNLFRMNLTHEQYLERWVTPFKRSKEISNEYRKSLLEV